jgi:hypothetical protein
MMESMQTMQETLGFDVKQKQNHIQTLQWRAFLTKESRVLDLYVGLLRTLDMKERGAEERAVFGDTNCTNRLL